MPVCRHDGQMAIEALLAPPRLWTREEVISRPSPVPKTAGVYAWYVRQLPGPVSVDGCHQLDGMPMLYVGIAPKRPYKDGRQSKSHLHQRVRYHYTGNAEGSTLRLTLGSLLSDALGIELRRVGSGTRRTFSEGEQRLSEWMAENAFVCWLEDAEPWLIERAAYRALRHPAQPRPEQAQPLPPRANGRAQGGKAARKRTPRAAR
jgi:GIY-YIG catalytic domain-containing protein